MKRDAAFATQKSSPDAAVYWDKANSGEALYMHVNLPPGRDTRYRLKRTAA